MIAGLVVTSCLLVTTVTFDASASSGDQGTVAHNRLRLESTHPTSWSPSQLRVFESRWDSWLPKATAPISASGGPISSGSSTATGTPTTATTTTIAPTNAGSAAATQYRLDLGLEVKSGLWEVAPVASVESAIGYKISVVMGYVGWSYPASEPSASDFPTAQLETLSGDGYLPEITWEPWNGSNGVDQPNFSLASIINGDHDSYIQAWAEAAKAYGKPLLIRFAQEMNGNWYPWSEQVNGNSPGEYVAAWQHVHNIFTEDGATNVKWIWSPNAVYPGTSGASSALTELYPGNAFVDYVGIDGYSYPIEGCPTASELFGPTLAITNQISDRPAMIAETGIDANCSSQVSLMTSLLNWTSANSNIVSLTFFDQDTATANYSLTSSLERMMHSLVSPLTMRTSDPDGL